MLINTAEAYKILAARSRARWNFAIQDQYQYQDKTQSINAKLKPKHKTSTYQCKNKTKVKIESSILFLDLLLYDDITWVYLPAACNQSASIKAEQEEHYRLSTKIGNKAEKIAPIEERDNSSHRVIYTPRWRYPCSITDFFLQSSPARARG